ncbi:MAG: transcriptional regulator [Candidatus Methanomethylicia archaeon]|nr:transcriptional regulator [Candidatus Methanomethylicia archaeon]
MKTPFEIGYRYIIPSLKAYLVKLLITKYNIAQTDIAKIFEISRSTVSRYFSMERGSKIDISTFKDVNKMLNELALKLLNKELDNYDIEITIMNIAMYILSMKYLCSFHSKLDLNVDPSKCRICPTIFGKLINNLRYYYFGDTFD